MTNKHIIIEHNVDGQVVFGKEPAAEATPQAEMPPEPQEPEIQPAMGITNCFIIAENNGPHETVSLAGAFQNWQKELGIERAYRQVVVWQAADGATKGTADLAAGEFAKTWNWKPVLGDRTCLLDPLRAQNGNPATVSRESIQTAIQEYRDRTSKIISPPIQTIFDVPQPKHLLPGKANINPLTGQPLAV